MDGKATVLEKLCAAALQGDSEAAQFLAMFACLGCTAVSNLTALEANSEILVGYVEGLI